MDTWNVSECGQEWWDHARKKMKNAIVYMDDLSCECLHWNGGVASVFKAGAIALREYSAFEVCPLPVYFQLKNVQFSCLSSGGS